MIIGIGGISRAGKSFLSVELRQRFLTDGFSVAVLDQDDYVLPQELIPRISNHIDWEIPESIDWGSFHSAIREMHADKDVVIAEGLLVFYQETLFSLYDHTIFLSLDYETFYRRKVVDLRWGKEPDWYINHIWQAHQQYGQPPVHPTLSIDATHPLRIQEIYQLLKS